MSKIDKAIEKEAKKSKTSKRHKKRKTVQQVNDDRISELTMNHHQNDEGNFLDPRQWKVLPYYDKFLRENNFLE